MYGVSFNYGMCRTTGATKMANANRTIEVKCKTKLNKDDKSPVTSVVTITLDDEKATDTFAGRAAIIAWQALARMAGAIPATDTVSISELAKRAGGGGFKATPESLANRVRKMPEAEYRQTLANLGLPKVEIDKMARKQYPPTK